MTADLIQLQPRAPTWERPDLTLLSGAEISAPEFPKALLGSFWSEWCEETAAGASAPFDYVAAALLTVGGALLGNSRLAKVGDWCEPPLLWCPLIGDPSTNKSPSLDALVGIVRDLDLRQETGGGSFCWRTRLRARRPKRRR